MKNDKTPLIIRLTPTRYRPQLFRLMPILGVIGGLSIAFFLIHGIIATPLIYLSVRPDAPLSRFYRWGILHMGEDLWKIAHFVISAFLCSLFFTFRDVMKWKQKAEQSVAGYPPQGVGSPEP